MSSDPKPVAKERISLLITEFFEAGRTKDFARLASLRANDPRFSKFDDHPPFSRQNFPETTMYGELFFASLSDFRYSIENLKIDVFDDMAIATFILDYGGVLVNNYTFEGRMIGSKSRVSMVLQMRDGDWLVVHEHLSGVPQL